jgi:2-alkyl-3-oxoalkanoate reductase
MAEAAAAAMGRRARSLRISRPPMLAVARLNQLRQSLGGTTQILTPAKVNEMFHPDWTVQDDRLAKATGFTARYDLAAGFRHTVLWYRAQKWL